MTSPEPVPSRPEAADLAALYDVVTVEHATVYGYGIVSAHSTPEDNDLVAVAMKAHRTQREQAMELLSAQSVTPPLPAAGYQLPMKVDDPADAAVAWRAVLEQAPAGSGGDAVRTVAVPALTQAAVLAARWKRILKAWPLTRAFPGGTD